MLVPVFQLAYLGAGAALVAWLGRSMALRPGFYLVGLGWALLASSLGAVPDGLPEAIQWLCREVGVLLLLLGAMHRVDLLVAARPA